MKLIEKFLKTTFIICILCIILISCASRQSVKTTEEFCNKNLTQMERNKFPKPTSPHESLGGHGWLQLELNNRPWMEYLRIGHKGETIIFVCGILDDSIVTFSKMPDLIEKARNGNCQLFFVNLPGNGYSTVPDRKFFNPIYLRKCLAEFILAKKIKEFTLVGNSNGGLVCVLLASHQKCGKEFRIKNILGFNPLLREISFWEMDKYQKMLVKLPSSLVQYTIQTPIIGRKFVELTLRSVENTCDVNKNHIDLFHNRLSENYRCGIWSDYLKNTLGMMPELKEISHEICKNISKHTNRIVLYSNSGDNWIPEKHVKKKAGEMDAEYKVIGNGHIPQMTHSELVEEEILKVLNIRKFNISQSEKELLPDTKNYQ